MILQKRVDIRYAKALMLTAKESNLQDRIYDDMLELLLQYLDNEDFRRFLGHSAIKGSDKGRILRLLFEPFFHPLSLDFILLILKKARLANIPGIASAFLRDYRQEHHLTTVRVRTSIPLQEDQKEHLVLKLEEELQCTVQLRCQIRPELLGGFQLLFDNKLYDNSIHTQLAQYRKQFSFNPHQSQI